MSAWIKPNALITGTYYVVSNGASGSTWAAYSLKLGLGDAGGTDGQIGFTVRSSNASGNNSVAQGVYYTPGVWTHVVGVNDGITLKLYINGTLVNTGTGLSTYNTGGPVRIGGDAEVNESSPRFTFPGSIDDVRIYNRALSAGEVAQLYNIGR